MIDDDINVILNKESIKKIANKKCGKYYYFTGTFSFTKNKIELP